MLTCGSLLAVASPSVAAEYIVTDQANGRVVAFNAATGAFTRTLVSGLLQPSAISWGPGEQLYVTDLIAGTILKINPATGSSTVFASGIDKPGSIYYDEWAGSMYVGEFGDFGTGQFGNEIFSYAPNGALIPANTINAGATGHSGLATDGEGNLYVSGFYTDEFGSGHVLKYSTPWAPNAFTPLGVFAPSPSPSPLLQGAAGMAFDQAGNLFVAGLLSGGDGALVKFTVTAGVVTGEATFDADIAFPSGMTVLPDGSLVVTSLGAGESRGTLYKYNTATGARVDLIPSMNPGVANGNFNGDSAVNGADLAAWRTAFGNDATANADGDGDSDGHDFLAWQRGLGGPAAFSPSGVVYYDPAGGGWAGVVPEPSAGVLAVIGALVAVGRGFRWRTG